MPLGVYAERPPADQSFIDSYDVGGSVPARVAQVATKYANDLNKLLSAVPIPIP